MNNKKFQKLKKRVDTILSQPLPKAPRINVYPIKDIVKQEVRHVSNVITTSSPIYTKLPGAPSHIF